MSEFVSVQGPESGEFELVVDSIQGLRQLIEKFAEKEDDDQKNEVSNSEHQSFTF